MNQHDDHDPDDPTRAELLRRVRELERENLSLDQVLESTFKAWLCDRKRLAKYEHDEFVASIKHMMEHPETTVTKRDVLDELERDSGNMDEDSQPPV